MIRRGSSCVGVGNAGVNRLNVCLMVVGKGIDHVPGGEREMFGLSGICFDVVRLLREVKLSREKSQSFDWQGNITPKVQRCQWLRHDIIVTATILHILQFQGPDSSRKSIPGSVGRRRLS